MVKMLQLHFDFNGFAYPNGTIGKSSGSSAFLLDDRSSCYEDSDPIKFWKLLMLFVKFVYKINRANYCLEVIKNTIYWSVTNFINKLRNQ